MPRTPGIRRTRRYIFNTLTVVSVLLLLATVGVSISRLSRLIRTDIETSDSIDPAGVRILTWATGSF